MKMMVTTKGRTLRIVSSFTTPSATSTQTTTGNWNIAPKPSDSDSTRLTKLSITISGLICSVPIPSEKRMMAGKTKQMAKPTPSTKRTVLTPESRTMMRRSWRYSPGATNCHSW